MEWALLLTLSVVWGASFFFIAVAITELPTFTIALLRVGLGAAALWGLVLAMHPALPRDRRTWRDLLLMALLNNAIPLSLVVSGQHAVSPGLAAILNATTPFFAVLIAHAFTPDERMSATRLLGSLAGLGGVAVMIGIDVTATTSLLHQLALVLAAVFYATGSVFGRRFAGLSPLVTAAAQSAGSVLWLVPIVLVVDRPWTLALPSTRVWPAVAALALVCTSLAFILYFTILKRAGATNLVLVMFLTPVSVLLFGWLFLDEELGLQHALGVAAIATGLVLVDGRLLSRRRPPCARESERALSIEDRVVEPRVRND